MDDKYCKNIQKQIYKISKLFATIFDGRISINTKTNFYNLPQSSTLLIPSIEISTFHEYPIYEQLKKTHGNVYCHNPNTKTSGTTVT